jgi:hypothetical protein
MVAILVMQLFDSVAVDAARRSSMLIFMLAAAMTLAMLIATAFGIHEETQRIELRNRARQARRFTYLG